MKYLIPPSEGKAKVKPQEIVFANTNFRFSQHVNQVVRLLSLIDDEDLRSVYGTKPEKALTFHRQNQDIFKSRCAYAIERYTGVVYEHIDWESLDDKSQKFMDDNIYIFSGLFGLLTPKTLIPDYKLKMNVLSLQHHWNPILTEALKDEKTIIDSVKKTGRLMVVDGAWRFLSISSEIISIVVEKAFSALKQPPCRITFPDIPTPSSWNRRG